MLTKRINRVSKNNLISNKVLLGKRQTRPDEMTKTTNQFDNSSNKRAKLSETNQI